MIRSTDLDSFVCCAVCSKIIPPPPSNATFDRIREYKPFRTRYYTHRDILEIGASIQQEERERKEAEIQERIEKMKAELWSQAEQYKEDAVDKALTEATANHSAFVQDLKLKLEKEIKMIVELSAQGLNAYYLRGKKLAPMTWEQRENSTAETKEKAVITEEVVRKAKAEMKEYMEEEQRRETEATEQRMAHKLRCALLECAKEKMQAVAEARKQERELALSEAAMQHRKHIEQLKEESMLAEEVYRRTIEQLSTGRCNEVNVALSIKQKENQNEMEKQMKELKTIHLDELEKVMITLRTAEDQVKALEQKLERMTAWKDSLETEIQATRQAFQKYIDATFPNLSPGQADFILPLRTTLEPKDIPKEAEGGDNECKRPNTESMRVTAMSKQHFK